MPKSTIFKVPHVISLTTVQYYLPPPATINKDFLKQVLAEEKQLLKKDEVVPIEVPHYDELAVKHLFPQFKKDVDFIKYFADSFPQGKGPPRDYFFNILNTQQPDYLGQIMEHAAKQRMSAEGVMQKDQTIKMTEYWEQ